MGAHTPTETASRVPGTGRKAGRRYLHSCIRNHTSHTLHGFVEYSNFAYILVSL